MNNESGVQTNESCSLWAPVQEIDGGGKRDAIQKSGVDLSSNFAYSQSVRLPSLEIRSSGNNILLATVYDITISLFYLRTEEMGGPFEFRILDFLCDSNGWKTRTPLSVGALYSYDGGQYSEYDSEIVVSCNRRLHFNKLTSIPVGNVKFDSVNSMYLCINGGTVWDRC